MNFLCQEYRKRRIGRLPGLRLMGYSPGWMKAAILTGLKYLEMRRRLVSYFDRKNCATPDELADETLNRVARRLEEEGAIESETPARYCYIVARFVFMEYLRETHKGSDRRLMKGGGSCQRCFLV